MRKAILFPVLLCVAVLLHVSCSSESDSDPHFFMESGSFQGTLPDGSEFGDTDIRSANGVTGSSVNQEYNGSHELAIRSFETGWSLSLETPRVEFDTRPPMDESDGSELHEFFRENYSYELLLEKLLTEKQKADSDPNYNGVENFRIVLTKEDEYYAYLPDFPISQGVGKVRVLEVREGIQKDLQGQDVRKIEVVVEMSLNLRATDASVQPQQGILSGIAQFKFREDFYQGEFEQ